MTEKSAQEILEEQCKRGKAPGWVKSWWATHHMCYTGYNTEFAERYATAKFRGDLEELKKLEEEFNANWVHMAGGESARKFLGEHIYLKGKALGIEKEDRQETQKTFEETFGKFWKDEIEKGMKVFDNRRSTILINTGYCNPKIKDEEIIKYYKSSKVGALAGLRKIMELQRLAQEDEYYLPQPM